MAKELVEGTGRNREVQQLEPECSKGGGMEAAAHGRHGAVGVGCLQAQGRQAVNLYSGEEERKEKAQGRQERQNASACVLQAALYPAACQAEGVCHGAKAKAASSCRNTVPSVPVRPSKVKTVPCLPALSMPCPPTLPAHHARPTPPSFPSCPCQMSAFSTFLVLNCPSVLCANAKWQGKCAKSSVHAVCWERRQWR